MSGKTNTMSSFSFVVPNSKSSDMSIKSGVNADTRKVSATNRDTLVLCPPELARSASSHLLPLTISIFLF